MYFGDYVNYATTKSWLKQMVVPHILRCTHWLIYPKIDAIHCDLDHNIFWFLFLHYPLSVLSLPPLLSPKLCIILDNLDEIKKYSPWIWSRLVSYNGSQVNEKERAKWQVLFAPLKNIFEVQRTLHVFCRRMFLFEQSSNLVTEYLQKPWISFRRILLHT